MINEKKQILDTINNLPDDITWEDAIYALYLQYKLAESKENIRNGKVISIEELEKHIEELKENYAINNI